MIVTVTLNPSLDRTVEVTSLVRGQVHRAGAARLHPGGKGVNVTRALLRNGLPSCAVLPIAGPDGDELVRLLVVEGVETAVVPVAGRTRSNISIAEPDGTVTKVNEPGGALSRDEVDEVLRHALALTVPGSWVVLCGSLPPQAPTDLYATLTSRLRAAGARVAVDSSGGALGAAITARPDLIKPNAEELAEAVGRSVTSRADVVAAARELQARGAQSVLVSLGAEGAMLIDAEGVLTGESVARDPRSTVGAGDAFLAGYLGADAAGTARRGALGQALAWGAAAVQLPGSQMPGPADIDLSSALVLDDEACDTRLTEPFLDSV